MNSEPQVWHPQRVGLLRWFLRLVGGVTLLAFGFALMPAEWFVWCSDRLGVGDFPRQPLGFYLARHLSALYGCVGVLMLVAASDVQRHARIVTTFGWGAIGFGLLQLVIDAQAGMPWWWTLGEGLSTVVGGVLLLALSGWARGIPTS